MKYNTATLFAAAAALVSITSASTAGSAECEHPKAGESGEPGICPMRPVTPMEDPKDEVVADQPPCVEVIVRDNRCHFEPVGTGQGTSVVSGAYQMAAAVCNCSGNSFAQWLDCQSCILENGLADDDVNQIWLQILSGAKSLLCDSSQPTDVSSPAPTTPAPVFAPIAPTTTFSDDPYYPPITQAPLDVIQAGPQTFCDEELSKQQDFSVTTVTGITLTASATNQSFSATALPVPTTAIVPPGLTVETTNGASSFGNPGLALVIVGSLVVAMM